MERMTHEVNQSLPEGSYRIVCKNCEKTFEEEKGNYTDASRASMKYSKICDNCGGEVVLETNPTRTPNIYSSQNPYPPKELFCKYESL